MIRSLPPKTIPGQRPKFGPWFVHSDSKASVFERCAYSWWLGSNLAWEGWKIDADPESRLAYILSKLENLNGLAGRVAGSTVYRWLEHKLEQADMVDAGLVEFDQQVARLIANSVTPETPPGQLPRLSPFEQDPKEFPTLEEIYYPLGAARFAARVEKTRLVVAEALQGACKSQYLALAREGAFGRVRCEQEDDKLMTFDLGGLLVYIKPDIVIESADCIRILDLKAGDPKPRHPLQVQVYALWAQEFYRRPVKGSLIYLRHRDKITVDTSEAALEAARAEMITQSEAIRSRLVDKHCNFAPADSFPPDYGTCHQCKFFMICHEDRDRKKP